MRPPGSSGEWATMITNTSGGLRCRPLGSGTEASQWGSGSRRPHATSSARVERSSSPASTAESWSMIGRRRSGVAPGLIFRPSPPSVPGSSPTFARSRPSRRDPWPHRFPTDRRHPRCTSNPLRRQRANRVFSARSSSRGRQRRSRSVHTPQLPTSSNRLRARSRRERSRRCSRRAEEFPTDERMHRSRSRPQRPA
jgi:hypothetical protein